MKGGSKKGQDGVVREVPLAKEKRKYGEQKQ